MCRLLVQLAARLGAGVEYFNIGPEMPAVHAQET